MEPRTARVVWLVLRTLDVALVIAALCAAAATWLTVQDGELLYYCGCADVERPADHAWFTPPLLLAALGIGQLLGPRWLRHQPPFELLTAIAVLAILGVGFRLFIDSNSIGPGAVPMRYSHAALLVLTLIRVGDLVRWRYPPIPTAVVVQAR
jgi:hypothetical protein